MTQETFIERRFLKKPLYFRFIKRLFDIVFSAFVIFIGFVPGLIGVVCCGTASAPCEEYYGRYEGISA